MRPRTVSLDKEYMNENTSNLSQDTFRTIDGLLEVLQQHREIKDGASPETLKRINTVGFNSFIHHISIIAKLVY